MGNKKQQKKQQKTPKQDLDFARSGLKLFKEN
jgi:phage-related protein